MAQYVSKTAYVEAVRWNKPGDHQAVVFIAGKPQVLSAQGLVAVNPGDWIINEPSGEGYYPCNNEAFELKYEPAPATIAERLAP